MPLDPSIPLRAVAGGSGAQGTIAAFGQGMRLRSMGQEQRLRELKIDELSRQIGDKRAARDVFARHAQAGTVGSQAYLREIGQVSPELYMDARKAETEQAKAQVELGRAMAQMRKLELDQQSAQLDQARNVNDFIAQKLSSCIDAGEGEAGQACYERSKSEVKDMLQGLGMDTASVDALPPKMDVQLINQYRMQSLSVREQLDQAYRDNEVERERAKAEAMIPVEVETARARAEATEESRVRVARERGVAAAERQAAATVRAAEIEKEQKPLTGAAAREVAEVNTTLEMLDDIQQIFKPEYVGQIAGRAGTVREVTGQITDEEIELRQLVSDIKDTLLRARSGAAITESEYRRLSRITPNVTDQPNVFRAKMRRFKRSLQLLRDQKLRAVTTGRGTLAREAEPTVPVQAGEAPSDPLGIR